MFNPVKIVKPCQRILTKESNKFVKTYFKQYITNEMIPVSILDDSPVPELCVAAECKLDPEILDLLQSHQIKPVQKLDGNLMTINRRLVKSVGLLSKIWHLLVKARGTASDENPSISVNKVIKQTVVCGGQPRVPNCGLSMSFEHALAFHQKPPKFKDILVCNVLYSKITMVTCLALRFTRSLVRGHVPPSSWWRPKWLCRALPRRS